MIDEEKLNEACKAVTKALHEHTNTVAEKLAVLAIVNSAVMGAGNAEAMKYIKKMRDLRAE